MSEVLQETEGGYTKERYDGNVVYRGPDGSFVKQQAFAASRQKENYNIIQDPETGEIVGQEPEEEGEDVTVQYHRRNGVLEDRQYFEGQQKELRIEVWKVSSVMPSESDVSKALDRARGLAEQYVPAFRTLSESQKKMGEGQRNIDSVRPRDRPVEQWHGVAAVKGKEYELNLREMEFDV